MNMSSQFQPVSQMHGPVAPVGGQPWLPSGSQGAPVTPVQQSGQQSSATASVCFEYSIRLIQLSFCVHIKI